MPVKLLFVEGNLDSQMLTGLLYALAEWCRLHSAEALSIIPEWQGLAELLRA